MKENNPPQEKPVDPNNIFYIKDKEIIISCILGVDSSPKLVNGLTQKGYNQFGCLSGGLVGLMEYFDDASLTGLFTDLEKKSLVAQKIYQQTNMTPEEYYRGLYNKHFLLITHRVLFNLKNTITEAKLDKMGIKNIYCCSEIAQMEKFINDHIIGKI